MSEPLSFEKVSIDDAKKVLDSRPEDKVVQPEDRDWRWARCFSPPVRLTDATVAWLAELPEAVRPKELPQLYARIANTLCEHWADPAATERFFDELASVKRVVGDHKERRHGFPEPVAQELEALRKHYFNPGDTTTLWDDNIYRR